MNLCEAGKQDLEGMWLKILISSMQVHLSQPIQHIHEISLCTNDLQDHKQKKSHAFVDVYIYAATAATAATGEMVLRKAGTPVGGLASWQCLRPESGRRNKNYIVNNSKKREH